MSVFVTTELDSLELEIELELGKLVSLELVDDVRGVSLLLDGVTLLVGF
jgi:hypothetical protein